MTQPNQAPAPGQNFKTETQQERWFKYGGNVLLVCIVVVVLAVLVIWLGQMFDHRTDTTTSGLYSLKPQTVSIIKNNKQPIKLVSLLTKTKQTGVREDRNTPEVDRIQPVIDLMEEYHDKGKNISYEVIDPATQPAKVEQLIDQVMDKYGGEVKKYREFIHDFLGETEKGKAAPTTRPGGEYGQLKAQVEQITNEMKTLVGAEMKISQEMYIMLNVANQTVQRFPRQMDDVKEETDRVLKQQPPDLKGAVDAINNGLQHLSDMLGPVIDTFKSAQKDKQLDPKLKGFVDRSLPEFQKLKDAADAQIARIKGLGELKLDTVRQTLKNGDAVLVLGETEMKAVPMDKIWQVPEDIRGFTAEGKPKPRFAGEQQITSAILSLTNKQKPKVCFVRPGGPPMTSPGIPGFQEGGPFSEIAQRLRDYNFDVVEKDLTGMWAMQAQMRQQFAPPEPSDEEIKDAIWIVINFNAPQQSPTGGPPPSIAQKVTEHIKGGGAALVLTAPRADALAEALGEFGVTADPQHVIVHEPVKSDVNSSDFIEQAQRQPLIFFLREWGDHAITRPINGLEGVIVPMIPVKFTPKPGYKGSELIPVPDTLNVWGESDLVAAMSNQNIEFNKPKAGEAASDLSGPFHVGAAVENDKGNRLVVIGSFQFAINDLLLIPDPKLAQQRIYAARFPANGELFMNSVFWLAHQDAMISISPMAMDTPRIGDVSKSSLNFWRIGVLLVGLPGLVILAGIFMFSARRD